MTSSLPSVASSTRDSSTEYITLPPVLLGTYFILAVVTIFGNALVIISYVIDRSIRRSTANAYIFNLAVADFFVGVFDLLATFIWAVSGGSLSPVFIPCFLWGCLQHAMTLFSAIAVAFLSWDRYKLVSDALIYIRDQTPKKAMVRSLIAWFFVILYVTVVHTMGIIFSASLGAGCIQSKIPRKVILVSFFPDFLIPLSITVVLNVSVLLALRRRTLARIEEQIGHHKARRSMGYSTNDAVKSGTSNSESSRGQVNGNANIQGELRISNETLFDTEGFEIQNSVENRSTVNKTAGNSITEISTQNHEDSSYATKDNVTNRADSVCESKCELRLSHNMKSTVRNTTLNGSKENIQNLEKKEDIPKEALRERKKLLKVVKALIVFTLIYIACWIPFYVVSFLSLIKSDLNPWAFYIGALILASNSAINPFIYAVMSMKFRNRFILISKCKFK